MAHTLEEFFKSAKSVRLSEEERAGIRGVLTANVSDSVRIDGRLRHTGKMRLLDSFLDAARNGRQLSLTEKEDVRRALVSHMRSNPLEDVDATVESVSLFHPFRFLPALAFSLLLVFSGTVGVYAMESSLPGDVLYPVKIHVVEEVRSALSLGADPRTRWHARRVERRLLELETLAVRGDLSPALAETVSVQVRVHMNAATAGVERLEKAEDLNAAIEISADLEASLEAHQVVLSSIAEQSQRNIEEIRMVLAQLRNNAAVATDLRMSILAEKETAESNSDLSEALDESIRLFRDQIHSVKVVIQDAPSKTKERNPHAQERLQNAQQQLDLAAQELENGDDSEAAKLAREALRSADEVHLFHELGLQERTQDTETNNRDPLSNSDFRDAAAAVGKLRKSVQTKGASSSDSAIEALATAEALLVEGEVLLSEDRTEEAQDRMQDALGTAEDALEGLDQQNAPDTDRNPQAPEKKEKTEEDPSPVDPQTQEVLDGLLP